MKFIRVNIDYCSYLIITSVLYFVDGGLDHCGKSVGEIGKFTQVQITSDGFCSANGPSCCQTWPGLVDPGLELLFGKGTYIKLNRLNDIIRTIRSKIGDLECHKNKDSPSQLYSDIVTSLDTLTDMNWIMLLNNTFHGNNCGRRLTELLFCSPDYCLYNQTEQLSHSCHDQCQHIMEACISDSFEFLSRDWKRAIGSLSTTLRILSAKTSCQGDKSAIDNLEWQLKEFRDPVSWIMESCATYGFNPCVSKTNVPIIKSQDMDKSIESHSSRLKSLISSLEKHWQGHEIISILDQDDLASSSSSGSGWNINDQFTDDEDLLNEHNYGSGSGQSPDGDGDTRIDSENDPNLFNSEGGSSTSSPPGDGKSGGSRTSQTPKGPPSSSSSNSRPRLQSQLYSFTVTVNLISFIYLYFPLSASRVFL